MTGQSRDRDSGHEASRGDATLEDAGQPPDFGPPVAFDPNLATGGGIAIGVFALIVLAPLVYRLYDTDAADPVDRIAVLTSLALLIVGVAVLLLGVYLVFLEIAGRLGPSDERKIAPRRDETQEPPREPWVLGAIARLRPLAVVLLLVALVPLAGAAWVAESGADRESGAAATPTARPASTRTPSATGATTSTP